MGKNQTARHQPTILKPDGGYRLIPLARLYAAWWCYKNGDLEFRDLRTYFALEEMAARRCVIRRGRTARYTLAELGKLTDAGRTKSIAASLRRLECTGISTWNEASIQFHEAFVEQVGDGLAKIANHRRRVPVPRRTLRWLAKARGPVLVATVLGHLFRCVYAKGRYIAAEGCISASWVAGVFGVDPRNVKRAKSQLRALNWLIARESNHWHRQRYGQSVLVNLAWMPLSGHVKVRCGGASDLPPRAPLAGVNSPPPESDRKLLKEFENQKPAERGLSGVCKIDPVLSNVRAEDLRDVGRVLMLIDQARKQGIISGSECDRLRFVGAAVRASAKATRNPSGFFSRLVRGKLWHHITAAEEDHARSMLKRHLFDAPTPVNDPPADDGEVAIPADVHFVAHVTKNLREHGYDGDPFEAVANYDPGWTRARWDRAMLAWLAPATTTAPDSGKCSRVHAPITFSAPFTSWPEEFPAGRNGVKVEPSAKRLRVRAE